MSSISERFELRQYLNDIHIRFKIDTEIAMNLGQSKGGYFSSILIMFSYIEFFGLLYTGEQNSKNATKFIRVFMEDINPRYSDIAGILFSILRHGTVHLTKPKKFFIDQEYHGILIGKDIDCAPYSDYYVFKWAINENGDDQYYTHLIPKKPKSNHSSNIKHPGIKMFPISLKRLFIDIDLAFHNFQEELFENKQLQENCFKLIKKIEEPTRYYLDGNVVREKHVLTGDMPRDYIEAYELIKL